MLSSRENVLKAIANETRLKILEALEVANGKTFIDLKNEFDLLDAVLSRHLKALTSTNLLSHIYERNRNNGNPRCYSYYGITEFGKHILRVIRNALGDRHVPGKSTKKCVSKALYRKET